MNKRFATDNLDIMHAVQSCNPLSPSFFDTEMPLLLIASYNVNEQALLEMYPLAKETLLQSKKPLALYMKSLLNLPHCLSKHDKTSTDYSNYNCKL